MPKNNRKEFEAQVLKALRGSGEIKLEIISIIIDALRKDPLLRDEIISITKQEIDHGLQ